MGGCFKMKRFFTIMLSIYLAATFSSFKLYAGGQGSCVGLTCGSSRTYWTDEQRASVEGRYGWWWALGEREREMFPNFYRGGRWFLGNVVIPVLGNPYVQKALEVAEQASAGATPTPADDALIRGLRNLPRAASGLDEASGLAAALGATVRRGGAGVPPATKQELRTMIGRGEVYLTEPSVFTVKEGFEEIITREAFHGTQRVGGYGMSRMRDVLEVSQIWTDPAYQGGHLATEAVAGYIRGNPNIRYIAASIEEPNTVKFIESAIEQGHPGTWMDQAVAATPLGKIGAATGATIRPVSLQRHVDPANSLPYYDVLVEIVR